MELIRTETRDRKAKLQDIAEKIMRKPESYDELEKRLTYWQRNMGGTFIRFMREKSIRKKLSGNTAL